MIRRESGFTLVETLMALALIALTLASTIFVLGRFNDYARSSRLVTCAQTVAQNEIDLILSARFVPQTGDIEPILVLGSKTVTGIAIYIDPSTGLAGQSGVKTTTITDASKTLDGKNLNIRRAVVTVSYVYRNRPHSVVLETLRAADL